MPTIRFTYDRDVARFGTQPVEVPEVTARKLVADRRAELVDVLEVAAVNVCDDCPAGGCLDCG